MKQRSGWALLLSLMVTGTRLWAAADPCGGQPACRVQGPVMAEVIKVTVTQSGSVTAYQGVRATLRFTNISDRPLVLGYVDRSVRVSDDRHLDYRWSSKSSGIGLVTRDSADPQFRLAPGESRDAGFEAVLQYSIRQSVPGTVFDLDLTVAGLKALSERSVHTDTEYALSFSGLTATTGLGARPSAPSSHAGGAVPVPPPAGGATDPCNGEAGCQVQGPVLARVRGITVTDTGNVTAYHTVRTTLRVRNVGHDPLILAYRTGSASLSDERGLAYTWGASGSSEARAVHGIGEVSAGSADPQLQLAPGEERDFSIDRTLQYNVRRATPGRQYNLDVTLVQLRIVGPRQIESLHDYAMSFSGLSAGGPGAASVSETARSVGGALMNLLQKEKK